MRAKKSTDVLEELQARLREWESVPTRAEGFHRSRRELQHEISEYLGRWWRPWIGESGLERLHDRLVPLAEVAAGVADIVNQAVELEGRVCALEERTARGSKPEVATWLRERSRRWKVALARAGAEVERSSELAQDRLRLEDLRAEIQLHEECLHWLTEAERIGRAVRSHQGVNPLEAAPFQAELPALFQQLLTEGATPDWLEEIRRRVRPLVEMLGRRSEPPPAVQTVQTLLVELRRWSQELERHRHEVENLTQRHGLAALEWRSWQPEQIDELLEKARDLLNRMETEAQELRQRELEALDTEIQDLVRAQGHDPELDEGLDLLKDKRVEHPQDHRAWMECHGKLRRRFEATATGHQASLRERLRTRVEPLLSRLEGLSGSALSAAVKEDASRLDYDLKQLTGHLTVAEVLRGLSRAEVLQREVEALLERSGREANEFEADLDRLRQRRLALAEALKRTSLSLPGSAGSEGTLEETLADRDLEQARSRLAAFESALAARERQFLERCTERLEENFEAARRIEVELIGAGLSQAPIAEAMTLPLPEDTTPANAARQLSEAAARHAALERRLEEALEELDTRQRQVRSELAAIPERALRPADRESRSHLCEELDSERWTRLDDPIEQLRLRLQLLSDAEQFLSELSREQRQGRRRHQELRRRLRTLGRERLRHFLPELADRAEAWIHGVPERPRRWADVAAQLSAAEALLGRLESQGRRLAAAELETAARVLRAEATATNPERASAASHLLAELDAHDPHTLPPVELRQKVLAQASTQGTAERIRKPQEDTHEPS